MKYEATVPAWAPSATDIGELIEAIKNGDSEEIIYHISHSRYDMSDCGWVKVGTAKISVELLPAKEMQNQQLATLQAELAKERAESQMRQNQILDRISKLQALEFSPDQQGNNHD